MSNRSLVSVVTPFYNTAPEFFEEAIVSVLEQSYSSWELLLVDDGSQGKCVEVAERYCRLRPRQVRYLRHPGGANLGMSASRNLGIAAASGDYLAFLDADDVWLPHTLSEQVSVLDSQPAAAMVYGNAEYWYSWTGRTGDIVRDFRPNLGIAPNSLMKPPALVPLLLSGGVAVPCTCSLLARRQTVVDALGGFEAEFRTLYEDQVFYIKVCLQTPVFVVGQSWGRYRQHDGMSTSTALSEPEMAHARLNFLRWVENYLRQLDIQDLEVWLQLRQQMWLCSRRHLSGRLVVASRALRLAKKWTLRLQRRMLPQRVLHWVWLRGDFDE
jgi:GT2 family glycosyltransferase